MHVLAKAKKFLNPFPNKPWFLHVCSISPLKTLGKGENAPNEQFLLFPQCFLPVSRTFCRLHQIRNCWLPTLSVWKSLKISLLLTLYSMNTHFDASTIESF